ncbi:DUF1707 domain-containing protein [Streptomyces sp. NPDC059740]|uniref:DUF1707 SHOCT-like domain-containing protein n=1 Tax=Streptomyces sp. NPDC059740 TaxID=3346926 RepID=UPI003655AA48
MSEKQPELRASDADRDRVAEVLRDALAEGRLAMEEFDERLESAYRARTYADLAPLTADLPAASRPVSRAEPPARATGAAARSWRDRITGGQPASSGAVAVLGGFQRKGRWTLGPLFSAFTFLGGGELDLREAVFSEPESVIRVTAVLGGVNIVVPPGLRVDVRGVGVMGGFDEQASADPGDPDAPLVVVTGLALLGGVSVERKPTKEEKRLLRAERKRLEGEGRTRLSKGHDAERD